MLRLFVKDNTSGQIHEYGTNKHDALMLQDDGSLHYENMQCCVGTKFPEEGHSFCLEDGTIPEWDLQYGVEPYLDIAGEYYTKPQTNADRIRAMSDEELACWIVCPHDKFDSCDRGQCKQCTLEWLKQPAE